ncbi:membrane transporter [Schizosaccharomyces japonicus yFS275]|uniref:Membrane transporter n=1 Tax=Schizosaccharomyces japonicus (strain yFS275 / FY16936) TaxID=402676 RepID=B6JXD2_SCHJY|nr:membrane transporter [Schizosaccharomyces japonicus yFS275]EEB06033.1 membrane transporter [Schizosaccharomyces japonicus yFS275]
MKFSHSLKFNSVPEWAESYIAYSNLKKLIYTLEHEQIQRIQEAAPNEQTALLTRDIDEINDVFRTTLDKELERVVEFYSTKESEVFQEFDHTLRDFDKYQSEIQNQTVHEYHHKDARRPRRASTQTVRSQDLPSRMFAATDSPNLQIVGSVDDMNLPAVGLHNHTKRSARETLDEADEEEDDDDDDDDDDEDEDEENGNSHLLVVEEFPADLIAYEFFVSIKRRLIQVYVTLHDLISYVQLNHTGFSKILKKYDKTIGTELRPSYMATVDETRPFTTDSRDGLSDRINKIASLYAELCCQNDVLAALKKLRSYLREHVAWERNTVWREMIAMERRTEAAKMQNRGQLQATQVEEIKVPPVVLRTKLGTVFLPSWLLSKNAFLLLMFFSMFAALLYFPVIGNPETNNCLALLLLVSLMWATEVIPLFVTALLVPFLTVFLRILKDDDGSRLSGKDSARVIFASMWNPTIVLLLGGFTLAAALSKYHIAKRMATAILSRVGRKPRNVLLMNMFVAMGASMWISNVAAPVLCFSITQPVLRNLPPESNFAKVLILGIALASNIGGMASPIASPQNIVALQNMDPAPGWGQWFAVSLPVCTICVLGVWFLLAFVLFKQEHLVLAAVRQTRDKFTRTQSFIVGVTCVTIILWCLERRFDDVFGDMGVIALLPILVFFGTGLLTKEDFNNFLWTVIVLGMGGVALGKAVSSSGLLELIATEIGKQIQTMGTYTVLLVFSGLTIVVATFVSHMVAAMIVLPIIYEVGSRLEDPHPRLFVMAAGLMCSIAMALPTSGFPNMTAIMMENEVGERYLSVKDFLRAGIPATVLSFFVVVTVGALIMHILGF